MEAVTTAEMDAAIKEVVASSPQKAEELRKFSERVEQAKQTVKGIAVCGSHPQTVMEAPFRDPAWLIYACSPDNLEPAAAKVQQPANKRYLANGEYRIDEWFEIHKRIPDMSRASSYTAALEMLPCTVWVRDLEYGKRIPNARPYPESELKEIFCPYLFTSSIAFMMAKAIVTCCGNETHRLIWPMPVNMEIASLGQLAEEARKYYKGAPPIPNIGLWGILQKSSDHEYSKQRPGTQYFLWEAARRGIHVHVAEESRLLELPKEDF